MNHTLLEGIDYQCLVAGYDDLRIGFCGRTEHLIVLGSRLFDLGGLPGGSPDFFLMLNP